MSTTSQFDTPDNGVLRCSASLRGCFHAHIVRAGGVPDAMSWHAHFESSSRRIMVPPWHARALPSLFRVAFEEKKSAPTISFIISQRVALGATTRYTRNCTKLIGITFRHGAQTFYRQTRRPDKRWLIQHPLTVVQQVSGLKPDANKNPNQAWAAKTTKSTFPRDHSPRR